MRVLGRFPQQAPLEIDGEILRFAALQLGADAETIPAYASRQQTVSEHQQRIGEYLRLGAFDVAGSERLARFLEDEALRLERTASLLARAGAWLRDEHVLAPAAAESDNPDNLYERWLSTRIDPANRRPDFLGVESGRGRNPTRPTTPPRENDPECVKTHRRLFCPVEVRWGMADFAGEGAWQRVCMPKSLKLVAPFRAEFLEMFVSGRTRSGRRLLVHRSPQTHVFLGFFPFNPVASAIPSLV